jgi:TolA-binding protein
VDKRIRYINNEQPNFINPVNGFEDDLMPEKEDQKLFESISDHMKAQFDLEDVLNDMSFQSTRNAVKEMITDYNKNRSGHSENEKFIRDNFSGVISDDSLSEEINSIKQEINNNKLNEITADWVKEWHEKKQKTGNSDAKSEEIRSFITESISAAQHEAVKPRTHIIRYTSLAAAAMLGVFLLLRSVLPSSNPEKLFSSNYKPFEALSTVTRSVNIAEADKYTSAIGSYKLGDYQKAAAGFAAFVEKNPSSVPARFFLGLSQLSLENYDQAQNLFSGVVAEQGEYNKEARWYLGLTYLKTGDKLKAGECFKILAGTDGYYRDRSEKILRRLK